MHKVHMKEVDMSCKYCKRPYGLSQALPTSSKRAQIYVYDSTLVVYELGIIEPYDYEEINETNINFCPMCGRALRRRPKWLYRLEATDPEHGLWYDGSGNWVWDVGAVDCSTKDLPMDYDWRYKRDGRDWFSSCSSKEDLLHWYSEEDAKRLQEIGFVMAKYLATEYVEYEVETTFIKETALERVEVPLEGLWK